jgi:hypothetical protein
LPRSIGCPPVIRRTNAPNSVDTAVPPASRRRRQCRGFASAAFGSSQASASTEAHATINTLKDWNGSQYIFPFGCPSITTYGQVITVPAIKTQLNNFTFAWRNYSGSGSMVVRGEVYAWDGTKATGASAFESGTRTIAFGDGL